MTKRDLLATTALTRKRYVALNDKGHRIGDSHPKAKLTNAQVDEMRTLHEQGDHGYTKLARIFGVPRATVRDIVLFRRRNQWADRHKIVDM